MLSSPPPAKDEEAMGDRRRKRGKVPEKSWAPSLDVALQQSVVLGGLGLESHSKITKHVPRQRDLEIQRDMMGRDLPFVSSVALALR